MKRVFNRYGMKQNLQINYQEETYNKVYQFSLGIKGEVLKVCNQEDVECIEKNYERIVDIIATLYSKRKE